VSREEQLAPVIQQLYDEVLKRGELKGGPEIVLVIDDADTLSKQLNDFNVKDQLGAIVRQGRDRGIHVILSGVPADFPTFGSDWVSDVKASQSGLLFGTLDPNDLSFFRIPYTESGGSSAGLKVLPPGQGYYVKRKYSRVKGAVPCDDTWKMTDWISEIRDRWHVVV
jgi:S-DNA-T family DNA segregation ATPase FtsK/SpoIIIE